LIRVIREPAETLPPDASLLNLSAGDGLALLGFAANSPAPGQPWPVRLVWRADDAITHDWSVSVRPTAGGQPLASPVDGIVQQDLAHPVHGAYPTSRWLPGEVVTDDYFFTLPSGPIPDGIQVVVYRVLPDGAFENLAQLDVPLR
jgi:hypothetical protein